MNPYYLDLAEMTKEEIDAWVSQIKITEYQRGWEDCLKNRTAAPPKE